MMYKWLQKDTTVSNAFILKSYVVEVCLLLIIVFI